MAAVGEQQAEIEIARCVARFRDGALATSRADLQPIQTSYLVIAAITGQAEGAGEYAAAEGKMVGHGSRTVVITGDISHDCQSGETRDHIGSAFVEHLISKKMQPQLIPWALCIAAGMLRAEASRAALREACFGPVAEAEGTGD